MLLHVRLERLKNIYLPTIIHGHVPTSYTEPGMRIVPFGSSGKSGRNFGFLKKECVLTIVLLQKGQIWQNGIKIFMYLGKSQDYS